MKETEKAWIAGFIEGEGCLTILKSKNKKKNGRIYVNYRPIITITNTSLELLEFCRSLIKRGTIYRREMHTTRPNCKTKYFLFVYRRLEVLEVCREILPFLRNKRKHAEILIEACLNHERLEELYPTIHSYNKKGLK